MRIRIGSAGIPLICKGKKTADAIDCVSKLGLSALELEFVKRIYLTEESAREVGKVARKFDVSLSCHAPYFINLASKNPKVIENSKNLIAETLNIADICGAKIVVVHAGFYMERPAQDVYKMIKDACCQFESKAKLGIETMGRQKQFGTVNEIVKLTEDCENVAPVIDFAHVHARGNGGLKTKEDFKVILDKFDKIGVKQLHCHMTGIKYENGNEKHHLPLSSSEPDFRLLAEILNENQYNVTIISESPLIEQDALLFKSWIKSV
ncbi:MAG: TIM barrel protein [DPANN group archaeon]|nr:TIM barrel protein [DPANN group archaeon]